LSVKVKNYLYQTKKTETTSLVFVLYFLIKLNLNF